MNNSLFQTLYSDSDMAETRGFAFSNLFSVGKEKVIYG